MNTQATFTKIVYTQNASVNNCTQTKLHVNPPLFMLLIQRTTSKHGVTTFAKLLAYIILHRHLRWSSQNADTKFLISEVQIARQQSHVSTHLDDESDAHVLSLFSFLHQRYTSSLGSKNATRNRVALHCQTSPQRRSLLLLSFSPTSLSSTSILLWIERH